MKNLVLFLVAALFAFSARAALVSDYNYQYQDPYLATLSLSILQDKHPVETFTMPALAGRDQVPLFERRAGSKVVMMKQNGPAPVIFVLPGVGGSSQDATLKYLSYLLFEAGYTTVALDNHFSWQFVLSQSHDAVPGFIPNDSRELYAYMLKVKDALPGQGVQATSYSFIGYSLGAINGGFVEMQDRTEHEFNFRRVILLNPPLDLTYALNELDHLTQAMLSLPAGQFDVLMGSAVDAGSSALSEDVYSPSYFDGLHSRFPLTSIQEQAILGGSFQSSLGDLIYLSQQVADRGLLTIAASKYQQNAREAQANSISFNQYVDRLVMPFWQAKMNTRLNRASFIRQGSLITFMNQLANDPAVYLLHNEDDFLDVKADALRFSAAMGSRASIYPYGGHCGNLWYPANRARIQQILKDAEAH